LSLPIFNGFVRIDAWLKYLPKTDGQIVGFYLHSFDVRVMDFLINFNTQEDGIHPLGVLITPEFKRIVEREQRVGIAFPSFTFSIAQLNVDSKCFSQIEKRSEGVSLRENTNKIFNVLNSFGRLSEVGSAYLKKADNKYLKPVHSLCYSIKHNRYINLDEFLNLFGGGTGTTPSWDDFCVGLLMCDRVFRTNAVLVGKNFFKEVREKTTLASFWQLRFAEVGKMSLLYERFLAKLNQVKLSSAEVVKCINFGHSSGTDILCGVHAFLTNFLLSTT